ncbi:MAG: hypothetical protein CBC35_08060 [Planctomycetes bacterium TMED75]|nr:hypothetical protein [Planctomycetaceae bacterium]OUU92038.1 MAG: hypothetical protein CBC35_08060 [Planctomycetes bacterium TMED75]
MGPPPPTLVIQGDPENAAGSLQAGAPFGDDEGQVDAVDDAVLVEVRGRYVVFGLFFLESSP